MNAKLDKNTLFSFAETFIIDFKILLISSGQVYA